MHEEKELILDQMKLELVPYGLSNEGDRTHPNHKPKS